MYFFGQREYSHPNTKTDCCGLIFEQRNGMFETLQLLLIGTLDTIFFFLGRGWRGTYIHDQACTYNPYTTALYCVTPLLHTV
jgi:hypothetical protein